MSLKDIENFSIRCKEQNEMSGSMMVLKKVLIFITMIIFLLSGCEVGKHKKPYSAKQLTGLLERKYESKDRFTFIKSIERDEYGRELHLFHDKKTVLIL